MRSAAWRRADCPNTTTFGDLVAIPPFGKPQSRCGTQTGVGENADSQT